MNFLQRAAAVIRGAGQGARMALQYGQATDTKYRITRGFTRAFMGDESSACNTWSRHKIMLECRDAYRHSEIARGLVNRFADYAVWLGIKPQCNTSSKAWNDEAEAWWNERYADACDYRNRPGYGDVDLDRQTIIAQMVDGDCGFVLLDNGQLQPVEAEQIQSPSDKANDPLIKDGIAYAPSGVITGYYVCPYDATGQVDTTKATMVPRVNFVHVVNPFHRFSQGRGLPGLLPVIDKLRDYDETDRYILNKIKIEGQQILKLKKGDPSMPNLPYRSYQNAPTDSPGQRVETSEFGQLWNMGVDEDINAIETRTPNPQYVGYLEHELRSIACAFGLPYEYLLMIFTSGSFSAQKAAMMHAEHAFRQVHAQLVRQRKQRVWNWRVAKAIKNKELPPAPLDSRGVSEWFRVTWSLPYFGAVDKSADVSAARDGFNMGIDSLRSIIASQGRDRDDVFAEKGGDISAAIAQANAINAANPGANVTWRDIIATSMPGQIVGTAGTPSEPPARDNSADSNVT